MTGLTRRDFTQLIGGAALAAGASGLLPTPSSAQSRSIVIATGVDSSYAPFVVGIQKGIFEKHGVTADLRAFDDGSVALDNLITGTADVGATGEAGGLVRRAKGGQFFVVSTAHQAPKWYGIVGGASIQKPKDLEGKRIGLVRGSGAHLFLTRYVKFHGLDDARIGKVFLQAPESVAAMARRDVDAICAWEPWLTRAVSVSPNARLFTTGDQDDIFRLAGYTYFSKRLLDDADLGRRTLSAVIEASTWVPANWNEAVDLTAHFYKLPSGVAENIMKMFTWNVYFDRQEFLKNFSVASDFAVDNGLISTRPDLDTFLRPELLTAVAPELVRA